MDDQTKQFLQSEAANAAEVLGVTTPNEPNVVEPTPEVAPAPAEAPVAEAPVQPAPETVIQPEVPAPAVEENYDDEPDIPTFYNPFQQAPVQQPQVQQVAPTQPQAAQPLPNLDPSQFTDQYGNVDMTRFSSAMQARDQAMVAQLSQSYSSNQEQITQQILQQAAQQAARVSTEQVMAAKAEERAWERTFEKYPQVKASKDLRDQIHKLRLGEVSVTGKTVAPLKVADRYFEQMKLAREEGVRQATQSVEVQSTAHLETANNTASEKGLKTQQDWTKIDSRDRRESDSARTSLLKQMIADGQI